MSCACSSAIACAMRLSVRRMSAPVTSPSVSRISATLDRIKSPSTVTETTEAQTAQRVKGWTIDHCSPTTLTTWPRGETARTPTRITRETGGIISACSACIHAATLASASRAACVLDERRGRDIEGRGRG